MTFMSSMSILKTMVRTPRACSSVLDHPARDGGATIRCANAHRLVGVLLEPKSMIRMFECPMRIPINSNDNRTLDV